MPREKLEEISPAEFFYRNREMAGLDNPARATYTIIRELVENSLDACEAFNILPDVRIRLLKAKPPSTYEVLVVDNGPGVRASKVPIAFGKMLVSSKYTIRQTRGTFGLGGKMSLLYGQITTNTTIKIVTKPISSENEYEFELRIDIERNEPIVVRSRKRKPSKEWHGLALSFCFLGDYPRAKWRILDYLKQTAMIVPYVNIHFVDPDGKCFVFKRITSKMPPPPKEVLPHPHGVDVELLSRLIKETRAETLLDFLCKHFHRVGERTARKFLDSFGLDADADPKKLSDGEKALLAKLMREYNGFLPPDASCLSPVGEDLLRGGILKELNPEFVTVVQRPPSVYSGHPFIVEAAIAYGGGIRKSDGILLYRFANKIPLLYDAHSDVSTKVIKKIRWNRYGIDIEKDPVALVVHICSTKIPFKTVGKEFIAEVKEVEYELELALKACARKLQRYLSKKRRAERHKKRVRMFEKYLPRIALFTSKILGLEKPPDTAPLLRRLYDAREGKKRNIR